jgi:hypothetical protein
MSMLTTLAKRTFMPRRGLLVTEGRVFCPVSSADTDAEVCLSCPWLTRVRADDHGAAMTVSCRLPYTVGVGIPHQ